MKTYITVSVLLLIFLIPIELSSCGIYISTGDLSRISLFQPDINTSRSMFPFFFSAHNFYSPDLLSHNEYPHVYYDKASEYQNDWEPIVEDWYRYLNKKATREDISYVLFEVNNDNYYFELDSLKKSNSFLRLLNQKKYKEELEYVLFAKDLEINNPWNNKWECPSCPTVSRNGIISWAPSLQDSTSSVPQTPSLLFSFNATELSTKKLASTNNSFLKKRYAFLLGRISYHSNNPTLLNNIYSLYFSSLKDSDYMKWYMLLYKAEAEEPVLRNYHLSLVFYNSPEKRWRAKELFNTKLARETMSLTKNNAEKGTILLMAMMRNPGNTIAQLRELTALDPTHQLMPFAITREINKLEDLILTARHVHFGPIVKEGVDPFYNTSYSNWYGDVFTSYFTNQRKLNDAKHCADLYQLLSSLVTKSNNNDFLNLSAGYVAYLSGNFTNAAIHYSNITVNDKTNILVKTQLELNKLVLEISQVKSISTSIEKRIVAYLDLLETSKEIFIAYEYMKAQFLLFMGKLFIEKQEIAKGIMLLAHSKMVHDIQEPYYEKNAYHLMYDLAKPKDFDEIISIINKPQTDFQKLLASPGIQYVQHYAKGENRDSIYYAVYNWDVNRILDIKSMYFVKNNQITEAYKTTCLIDDNYWSSYPYHLFINDDPFWVYPSNTRSPMNFGKYSYNKKTILKKVMDLFITVSKKSGDEQAQAYFQIANFYLSTTYYGKYWILSNNFSYQLSGYNYRYTNEYLKNNKWFFSTDKAKYYYMLAARNAQSPDLKAMSAYFAWICSNKAKNQSENPYLAFIKQDKQAMGYHDSYSNCLLVPEFFKKYYQ